MSSPGWLHDLRFALAPRRGRRHRKGRDWLRDATHRLNLEVLEDRVTPSFSPATSFPVGPNPQAVVTADFNNDGHLDLATANYYDGDVSGSTTSADMATTVSPTKLPVANPRSVLSPPSCGCRYGGSARSESSRRMRPSRTACLMIPR